MKHLLMLLDCDLCGHEKLMEDQEHKIQISKLLLILRVLGTELNRDKDTRSTVLLKSIEWAVEGFPDVTDIEKCATCMQYS